VGSAEGGESTSQEKKEPGQHKSAHKYCLRKFFPAAHPPIGSWLSENGFLSECGSATSQEKGEKDWTA
jgi:hypothetical protein